MKRILIITISALALLALIVGAFFYIKSLEGAEEAEEEKPVSEISVWKETMAIECPENLRPEECKESYESAVSEVTGLQPDTAFADSLVEDLWVIADYDGTEEEALKTIAGWDINDTFELSPLYGEEFFEAIKDKSLDYIFIGVPGDSFEATPSDTPFIPVTLVGDGEVIGSFEFSYINLGDSVIPCIKDLCEVV